MKTIKQETINADKGGIMPIDLSFIHTGNNISYTDIPSVEFFSQYEPTKENKPFLSALKVYKQIDKSELEAVESRILLLNFLKTHLGDEDVFTKAIKETISKKIHHLRELQELFRIGVLRNVTEIYNPEIEKLFKPKAPGNLYLKNSCIYDYEGNVMLGNYILEAVDPAHRFNLTSYLDKWKSSCSHLPFFLYLEQNCNYDLIPQVHYFSDKELKEKKIIIDDGLLNDSSGNPITTNPAIEYLFIYDMQGNFYGTNSSRTIKHTSLSRGRPVQTAGSLELDKGKITHIGLDSGHYFPSLKTIFPLLSMLRGNGVHIKGDTKVLYHDNFQKYRTTVKGIERC